MFPESNAGPPGIDRDIGMISAGVGELRRLASDQQKAQDSARIYDFSIRWGVLMSGRLQRLDHYHQAGALTQDQERRHRGLREELKDAAPQAERLGIARPDIWPKDCSNPPS
jgi:hypothetical protein